MLNRQIYMNRQMDSHSISKMLRLTIRCAVNYRSIVDDRMYEQFSSYYQNDIRTRIEVTRSVGVDRSDVVSATYVIITSDSVTDSIDIATLSMQSVKRTECRHITAPICA